MKLSDRQLAHTLAALRYCQDNDVDLSGMEHFGPPDGVIQPVEPLDNEEVNELCESLNTAE